jgi:phosphoglycolate phosphatase
LNPQYTAVLFDLDGTLLDTLDDIADACNRVLIDHGFSPHPTSDYRYHVGDGVTMLLTRALPKDRHDPTTLETCIKAFYEEYGNHWNVKTQLYDGIADLLDELTARKLKLAVLSNKPHAFTIKCVETYLAKWKFEACLGQRDGVPRKPDPAAALEIARRLNVPTEQFLYVGDTATDMQTAIAARMYPVGVLWGFRPREELEHSGAHTIIQSPRDLLLLLNAPA